MPHDLAPPPDRRVKVPHLVMALLFLGTALAWVLVAGGVLDATALPFLGPGLLVLAGVGGLLASLRGTRRPSPHHQPPHQPSDTMDDPHDPADEWEHTAPLHRPEDHR